MFATVLTGQTKDNKPADDSARSRLRVEVTGGDKSTPVDMASVYVKFTNKRALAKDEKVEMDVKTNRDGIAVVPSVPRGKIVLQVVAPGWKPFGENFELSRDEEVLKIHLDRPPKWY
ncbi:MAG TPA: hypothetical protein VFO34_08585 [Candidatus Acidoferrales bacterium]|nr:hypothetical protein [Candidatus Acidoferrales bacterium]